MAQTLALPADANPANHPAPRLSGDDESWSGRFQAMASPCEILLDGVDSTRAEQALREAIRETWRIERHLSRYVPGNPVDRLNHSAGQPVDVDEELARLLNYADQCYRLSEGRFDITSGVLRRVWRFDGSDALPASADVEALRPFIGWDKVRWDPPSLTLPVGMELDFGGIGKEYAVDRVLHQLSQRLGPGVAILVNFGGDLACSGPRRHDRPWQVGVEDHHAPHQAHQTLALHHGALATSGDTR
ncbi:MAG: FAD:protein FMN transferase, partial [Gammaproteobacteria bacterium]|nr:FAD:protein FMN transferase [Gammaproteobacteria bacterium]